ncbi:Ribosome production factor 2-like [Hondaea fermentalgiana]|uniref:Ribosome production factor 2 homolog n=1 Tax=Hondaea fermentalgiana TaxID=2315210 RepID=A0A2R5GYQ3_9STRA|nr:Ribosome production factor 2-like [Hondaea fermentalgiana]|eukprot:GBG33863.1 Ribosome production factor 2-like [Hondaea fermentalgiana]
MGKPLTGKRKRGHVLRRQKALEPKVHELEKKCLLVRGSKVGPYGLELLRDLRRLRGADNTTLFSRKNDVLPFEDETRMEFLCGKNDCGVFALATHSKKRPNNVVLGRIYDNQTLDMVEIGVTGYQSFEEVLKRTKLAKAIGSQTAIIFQGDEFDKNEDMQTLRSILLDIFRERQVQQVDLTTIDHIVCCSAVDGKVYVRNYVVAYAPDGKKNQSKDGSAEPAKRVGVVDVMGQKIPNVQLIDMGPNFNFVLRRTRLPSTQLAKLALRQPKVSRGPKKVKNVTHDALEGKVGRVHMKRQDTNKLVTRSRFKKALSRGGQKDE